MRSKSIPKYNIFSVSKNIFRILDRGVILFRTGR